MKLIVDTDFRSICAEIVAAYEKFGEASLVWSDDQYQHGCFCGGWCPSGERGPAFYFSYLAPDGGDYIFSFLLDDAKKVASGGSIDPPLVFWKQAPDW